MGWVYVWENISLSQTPLLFLQEKHNQLIIPDAKDLSYWVSPGLGPKHLTEALQSLRMQWSCQGKRWQRQWVGNLMKISYKYYLPLAAMSVSSYITSLLFLPYILVWILSAPELFATPARKKYFLQRRFFRSSDKSGLSWRRQVLKVVPTRTRSSKVVRTKISTIWKHLRGIFWCHVYRLGRLILWLLSPGLLVPPFSKIYPDPDVRLSGSLHYLIDADLTFWCSGILRHLVRAYTWSGYFFARSSLSGCPKSACSHYQTMSRALGSLENGFRNNKSVYFGNE